MSAAERTIGIRFGALAPSIAEQVATQGAVLLPSAADRLQIRADAVEMLRMASVLSDAEARKARQRLLKQILAHARPR